MSNFSIPESNNDGPKLNSFLPLLFSLFLGVGIFLGWNFSDGPSNFSSANSSSKFDAVLNLIEENYVDSVNIEELVSESLDQMLQNLDPHSSYLPPDLTANTTEQLDGKFGGVGIRFMVFQDTLVVTHVIDESPALEAGLKAGDQIIVVGSDTIVDQALNTKNVMDNLKGSVGTMVKIKVRRRNEVDLLPFSIIRGIIPINSIEAAFMLTDEIGFIKLDRFATRTHFEFAKARNRLLKNGMKKLIFDLRGNGGGYLDQATKIADEFLKKGKLIVYTEGRSLERENHFATNDGKLEDIDVVLLIDQSSASASEIVAGALQDNDRGIIMGRRSFGKGLVQQKMPWDDGSSIRLTIARYYTPVGRCIQKPYGKGIDYGNDQTERLANGEFYQIDSSVFVDSLKYITEGGKEVYGGGGIMPDVFVPYDTSSSSSLLTELYYNQAFFHFGFLYADQRREEIQSTYKDLSSFANNFNLSKKIEEDFKSFVQETKKIQINENQYLRSRKRIISRIKSEIARTFWEEDGFYKIYQDVDLDMISAIETLTQK